MIMGIFHVGALLQLGEVLPHVFVVDIEVIGITVRTNIFVGVGITVKSENGFVIRAAWIVVRRELLGGIPVSPC